MLCCFTEETDIAADMEVGIVDIAVGIAVDIAVAYAVAIVSKHR